MFLDIIRLGAATDIFHLFWREMTRTLDDNEDGNVHEDCFDFVAGGVLVGWWVWCGRVTLEKCVVLIVGTLFIPRTAEDVLYLCVFHPVLA